MVHSDSDASIMLWLKLVPIREVLVLVDRLVTSIPHDAGDQLGPSFVGPCSADEKGFFLGHRDVVP